MKLYGKWAGSYIVLFYSTPFPEGALLDWDLVSVEDVWVNLWVMVHCLIFMRQCTITHEHGQVGCGVKMMHKKCQEDILHTITPPLEA